MNTLAFAIAVVAAYFRKEGATRPIDKKIEAAKLAGMFKAANALGLGMTEFEVEMTFLDAVRSMRTARPQWRAIDNSAQKSWDSELAARYYEALKSL